MSSLKEQYQLRIINISQKVLELHLEYRRDIGDICDDIKFKTVSIKYRHPHQATLNFKEE